MVPGVSSGGISINRLLAAANRRPVRRPAGTVSGQPTGREQADGVADAPGTTELTDAEKKQVEELKRRDTEVHRHEQAHKAAAGSFASGGPTFEYQTGPDGTRYAVGGEVRIDTSPVSGNPQATIAKMQQVRRAANAPAQPSAQDRQVAAKAAQIEQQARLELNQTRAQNPQSGAAPGGDATPSGGALEGVRAMPGDAQQSATAYTTTDTSASVGRFIDARA